MAAAREVFSVDAKLEALKLEILRTFDELCRSLVAHRDDLLFRHDRIKEGHDRNVELEEAINQPRITNDTIQGTMINNLVGASLDAIKERLVRDIETKVVNKVVVENLEFVEFRCSSGKIRKAVEETDLIELIPEYVRRENTVIKRCRIGRGSGEFINPSGILIDRIKNEVFITDLSNSRIQILTTEGEYLRSFGTDHLKEPYGICVSQDDVFVTDMVTECLSMFSLQDNSLIKLALEVVYQGALWE